jgi:hypothetical protein
LFLLGRRGKVPMGPQICSLRTDFNKR